MPLAGKQRIRRLPPMLSALAALTAAMALAGAACDTERSASPLPPETASEKAAAHPASALPAAPETTGVRVTVTGAVVKPGVYTLDPQANVAEAIIAAGGLTEKGTLRSVNIKGALRSGMTVVVPTTARSIAKTAASVTTLPAASPLPRVPTPAPNAPMPLTLPTVTVKPIPPLPIRATPATVRVTVKGAVAKPGTYTLYSGELVASAIIAAGGPTAAAVMGGVDLNQSLRSGMTLTIPANKTAKVAAVSPVAPDVSASAALNINDAQAAQLQHLPGIGPALAARIVAYRKEVGAFRSPEQLLDVKGITPEKFSAIQPLVRTN